MSNQKRQIQQAINQIDDIRELLFKIQPSSIESDWADELSSIRGELTQVSIRLVNLKGRVK